MTSERQSSCRKTLTTAIAASIIETRQVRSARTPVYFSRYTTSRNRNANLRIRSQRQRLGHVEGFRENEPRPSSTNRPIASRPLQVSSIESQYSVCRCNTEDGTVKRKCCFASARAQKLLAMLICPQRVSIRLRVNQCSSLFTDFICAVLYLLFQ